MNYLTCTQNVSCRVMCTCTPRIWECIWLFVQCKIIARQLQFKCLYDKKLETIKLQPRLFDYAIVFTGEWGYQYIWASIWPRLSMETHNRVISYVDTRTGDNCVYKFWQPHHHYALTLSWCHHSANCHHHHCSVLLRFELVGAETPW